MNNQDLIQKIRANCGRPGFYYVAGFLATLADLDTWTDDYFYNTLSVALNLNQEENDLLVRTDRRAVGATLREWIRANPQRMQPVVHVEAAQVNFAGGIIGEDSIASDGTHPQAVVVNHDAESAASSMTTTGGEPSTATDTTQSTSGSSSTNQVNLN
jgi:hypothetical protein